MLVGLILCGRLPDRYAAISGNYPALISGMFENREISLEVFDSHLGSLPLDIAAFDGIIISGSRHSVYEDERWIRDLEAFAREVADSTTPVFGICFGHQLLARAFGGVVEHAEGGWGVGVHTMRVLERRLWMEHGREALRLVMSHQDQVVDLPDGAVVLGSSDHCRNYLIEFTPTCIGMQGHPEFTTAFARALYEDKQTLIGTLADEAIESLATPADTRIVQQWVRNLFGEPLSADSRQKPD
jgi:GMP synthase-like glutamine amidotransferase